MQPLFAYLTRSVPPLSTLSIRLSQGGKGLLEKSRYSQDFFTLCQTSAVFLPFLQLLESVDSKMNYLLRGRISATAIELHLMWPIINISRTLCVILNSSLLFHPTKWDH